MLGLLVAVAFGTADFLGGRASRQADTVAVLAVTQTTAAIGSVAVVLAVAGDVTTRGLANGAVAGVLNGVGLGLLYRGLATGRMGVVAPVTAVVAAVVPVAWGLVDGQRVSGLTMAGVVVAIVAGALIGREPGSEGRTDLRSIAWAVLAGAGLGGSLVFFARTSSADGMWPVLAARWVAAAVVGLALGWTARRARVRLPTGATLVASCVAGALDVTATTMLVVALRRGLAVEVAPVAALAPGFTVLLARLVLQERIGPVQVLGLAAALAGLVLVAAG